MLHSTDLAFPGGLSKKFVVTFVINLIAPSFCKFPSVNCQDDDIIAGSQSFLVPLNLFFSSLDNLLIRIYSVKNCCREREPTCRELGIFPHYSHFRSVLLQRSREHTRTTHCTVSTCLPGQLRRKDLMF
ncbi:hypothetical protein PUN28_006209 [Cardiocondyla obscurior]|uniref:Uncharacterized protein n=1 Tax=Cardiocondyla obscurior TaxID=286306 RepID=A0AAW2GBA7_9HYME